ELDAEEDGFEAEMEVETEFDAEEDEFEAEMEVETEFDEVEEQEFSVKKNIHQPVDSQLLDFTYVMEQKFLEFMDTPDDSQILADALNFAKRMANQAEKLQMTVLSGVGHKVIKLLNMIASHELEFTGELKDNLLKGVGNTVSSVSGLEGNPDIDPDSVMPYFDSIVKMADVEREPIEEIVEIEAEADEFESFEYFMTEATDLLQQLKHSCSDLKEDPAEFSELKILEDLATRLRSEAEMVEYEAVVHIAGTFADACQKIYERILPYHETVAVTLDTAINGLETILSHFQDSSFDSGELRQRIVDQFEKTERMFATEIVPFESKPVALKSKSVAPAPAFETDALVNAISGLTIRNISIESLLDDQAEFVDHMFHHREQISKAIRGLQRIVNFFAVDKDRQRDFGSSLIKEFQFLIDDLRTSPLVTGISQQKLRLQTDTLALSLKNYHELVDHMLVDAEKNRLVKLESVFENLPERLQYLESKAGKKVNLTQYGMHFKVDKYLPKGLKAILDRLLETIVEYRIQDPDTRAKLDKPDTASIDIHNEISPSWLTITVKDDGMLYDLDLMSRSAIDQKLLPEKKVKKIQHSNINQLIFHSDILGEEAQDLEQILKYCRSLGGSLTISAVEENTYRIKLPITPHTLKVFLIQVGSRVFAMPVEQIVETTTVEMESIDKNLGIGKFIWRGQTIPALMLNRVLNAADDPISKKIKQSVMIVKSKKRRIGLMLDQVIGRHMVVIHSYNLNKENQYYDVGITYLKNGQRVSILDAFFLDDLIYEK
ncbi:MAG: hypothetical protein B6244_02980, partial [Candidatus Cloacimonetes bacterium 4572_55]